MLGNFGWVELAIDALLLGGEFVKAAENSIGRW
jgi:hypothetical protein